MDDTVNLTFWVTGVVFVVVNLFMAYAVVRYRHRKDQERAPIRTGKQEARVVADRSDSIGVIAMLAPGLVRLGASSSPCRTMRDRRGGRAAMALELPLPATTASLGTVDASLVTPDNPFGIDANDPKRTGRRADRRDPELHLPLDKPVKVLLRSKDVLHNFTVHAVPGQDGSRARDDHYLWLTPTQTGEFEILCEEMCGLGSFRHARTRRRLLSGRLRHLACSQPLQPRSQRVRRQSLPGSRSSRSACLPRSQCSRATRRSMRRSIAGQ